MRIEGHTPEAYAAQWGCDPVYDKPPRQPGDGYLFYNFGSEKQKRSPEWLDQFIAAIERTIRGKIAIKDRRGLLKLLRHVKRLRALADIDDFTRGYITAALWAETDDKEWPLDDRFDIGDLDDSLLVHMVADCKKFQAENAAMLERACEEYPAHECTPQEYAGHDFWLTRRGHGCGFWDGDLSDEVGDTLTAAAKKYHDINLYHWRGKVYA